MENVSIRFLEGESDASTLRQLYDTVIASSFLPAEREPVEKLGRVLSTDELRGAIAVTPDGVPVGALFLEWFADIRAALLCYFAVRPDLRGQGIGRRLIAVATPQWRATLKPHVVFAEAEDPRLRDANSAAHTDGAANMHGGVGTDSGTRTDGGVDYGDGHARLRLYAGFGAYRLPIPYLMPELAPGAGRMPGLLLQVAEADEVVSPTPDRIRSTVVEDSCCATSPGWRAVQSETTTVSCDSYRHLIAAMRSEVRGGSDWLIDIFCGRHAAPGRYSPTVIDYGVLDRAGRRISLRAVGAENWRAVADIAPRDDQRHFVAALAARYLLLSVYGEVWHSLAVHAGDTVAGHVMWGRDDDGSYWIGGMMVDRAEQGHGVGRAALRTIVRWLEERPDCAVIRLSYHPDNVEAARLYASLGFAPTGAVEDGEVVAERSSR